MTDTIETGAAAPEKKANEWSAFEFVTVDSESTRDIDDALHICRTEQGYRILVAIANPTKLVKIGSTEDEQARLIAATAYARDKVIRRMLPSLVSEHKGSLVAGQDRPVMLFDIALSDALEVLSFSISSTSISVTHRLSYESVPVIIKDESHPAHGMLAIATTLARLLLQARRNRGALAMYDLSRLLLTDEEGNLQLFHSIEDVVGHILVQEMMILTNHLAAKYMVEHDIPGIFRNHEPRLTAPPADELALTIEGWLNGQNTDTSALRAQFSALTGKARYGATAKGHYGLNLPAYLHVTSPLRRYADLANMRQLAAHLKTRPLPYKPAELGDLATDLNEALDRRKEERSDGFKAVVQRTAESALDKGSLGKLAEHELRQALKLSRDAGYLPQVLIDEVVTRFNRATISDSLADTLLTEVPLSAVPEEIRHAMAQWMVLQPPKAMHLLMHGQQAGYFTEVNLNANGEGTSFSAKARVVCADGRQFEVTGQGGRKREAEQSAAIAVISAVMEIADSTDIKLPTATQQPLANINYKGRLLELCQKHGIPAPNFASSGQGPSHAMFFCASATMTVAGQSYRGEAIRATTKKEAEALASKDLLDKVESLFKARVKTETGTEANPIGRLQEMAQTQKVQMPSYDFSQAGVVFRCTATTYFGKTLTFNGSGNNKQEAKKQAAIAALKAIRE